MQDKESIMNDKRRRYRTIKDGLKKLYPVEPTGNLARQLNTLAYLISGIVGSKRVSFPAIAEQTPDGTKNESRVKKFARWIANEHIEAEVHFLPFAEALVSNLALHTLVLVMDGSEVGRQCLTLMLGAVYKKRALPIAWIVVKGSKGHFSEETHVKLAEQAHRLVPEGSDVIFLGDGEFDGTTLQAAIGDYGWKYVCRTAKNTQLCEEGDWFSFDELWAQPGDCFGLFDVLFTQRAYGPVLAIVWWKKGCEEPIYLVTNLELVQEACRWYARRFRIETFFSDQKSRGFHLHKSHVSNPERLARLMIAACLAYIWIISLGIITKRDDWVKIIHRADRCDLSLFRLGLSLLEHLLDEQMPIPMSFQILGLTKSVR